MIKEGTTGSVEETELAVRLKDGDKYAFDLLYEKYKNVLFRMAYLVSGSREDVTDGITSLDRIVKSETQRQVKQAVYALDFKHRAVVVLYYYNEMTAKEIAGMQLTCFFVRVN